MTDYVNNWIFGLSGEYAHKLTIKYAHIYLRVCAFAAMSETD